MDKNKELIKEPWVPPTIYSIDFKETHGGPSAYTIEDNYGDLSDLPG